jgi:tetratricopeptide (TPR) repeat protein
VLRRRSIRGVAALVVALGVLLLLSRPARAQEETPEVMRGLDLESASRFREAAVLFRHSLETTPTPGALLGLERVYAELRISDSLLPPLDSLIARYPREGLYRSVKLRTLQLLGRQAALRDAFEQWVAATPHDPAPYRDYARILIQLGQPTSADSVVQRGAAAIGDARPLDFETAQLRAAEGQWEASAQAWRRALVDAPHLAAAAAYALAPTPAAQRARIRDILMSPPAQAGPRRAVAELSLNWGDASAAWDALKVLPPDSTSAGMWVEFGERALAEERYAMARDALSSALRVQPSPELALEAATAALRSGSPAEVFDLAPLRMARDSAQAAARYVPLHVAALAALGRGADAEALVARYDRWLAPGPRTEVGKQLATAWVRSGDLDRARAALAAAGPDADSSDSAGWLALYEGRLADARTLMRGIREPGPELAVALGIVARTRGDSAPVLGSAFLTLARGDSAGAASRFVAAASEHPEAAPAILLVAARIDAARGDATGALALWQRIVSSFGESPEAVESELEWARLLRRRGDRAGAIAHLEHLILSAPDSALLPQARRELELAKGTVPSP